MHQQLKLITIRHQIYRFAAVLLLNLAIFSVFSFTVICPGAIALLRQHHETPDVLRYHAQDSLKDSDGNTWQVILFPDRLKTPDTTYYLRLVGFPGVKSFSHPQPLEIITDRGDVFTVVDAYAESAPAPNVGQYDLTTIIADLPRQGSLKLAVTMQGNQELALKIPREVLTEWKLLTKEIEN